MLISSLTTEDSTTEATPRGTFLLTQTAEPSRVRRGSTWVTLDARLHLNLDKSLSPNVSTSALTLSGGGSTKPLATMSRLGRSLSLSWPTTLPTPTVNGATATYAGVFAGVDLVVTATPQGGFSDVLVVKTKQAAANPQLAQLSLATKTTGGLTVTTDSSGNLTARTSAKGTSVFSAPAPTMWDSSTASTPTDSSSAATESPQASKAAKNGKQWVPLVPSSIQAPGNRAHIAMIKAVAVRGLQARAAARGVPSESGSLRLAPDRKMLTGATTVFPVYIDPFFGPDPKSSISVDNQGGSRTDKLQVGYCGWDTCIYNGQLQTFKARSFVHVTLKTGLTSDDIRSSTIQFPYASGMPGGCTGGYATRLWWSGTFSSSTKWPGPGTIDWGSNNYVASDTTYWGTGCTADQQKGAEFNVTSFIKDKAGVSNMTFALKAGDESETYAWRQFSTKFTMSTEYDRAPTLPTGLNTAQGGACNVDPAKTIIGNDDVRFQAVPNDPDASLDTVTTTLFIKKSGGAQVYTATVKSTAPGKVVTFSVGGPQILSWSASGGQYSWYVSVADSYGRTSPTTGLGTVGSPCSFTYDPSAPQKPDVTPPASMTLGQPATFRFGNCESILTSNTACTGTAPSRYIYQLNGGPTHRIAVTGPYHDYPITSTHAGVNTITVSGLSVAGNAGDSDTETFTVDGPDGSTAHPYYRDGDFDGDGNPDVIAPGFGSNPGLWLSSTDSTGIPNTAVNVGALGTGVNTGTPGIVPASEWVGTQVLHGDFTGRHVQDVIAYYPAGTHAGSADLLFGGGDILPLNPRSGSQQTLQPGDLGDGNANPDDNYNPDNPIRLVAAGNASLDSTGIDDLVGISGDATNGYTLNLYTGGGFMFYHMTSVIAGVGTAPAAQAGQGSAGWDKYTLLAAQPSITVGGTTYKQTELFAIDTTTGTLWAAVNTTDGTTTSWGSYDANGQLVTPAWTQISTPWTGTTSIPAFVSTDVRPDGTIEFWAQSGVNVSPYTLSGTTLTAGTAASIVPPARSWPLTDGISNATTAVATRGDTAATINGGVTFTSPSNDVIHSTVADFNGQNGSYLQLPDNMLSDTNIMSIHLEFKAPNGTTGILLSAASGLPSSSPTSTIPVMYIGTDGRLYAQFWNGTITPMISPQPVDDGQWHSVTLTSTGTHQGFYLDANIRIGMAGSNTVLGVGPTTLVGSGEFNGNAWLNAPTCSKTTSVVRECPFTGQIANVAYYKRVLYDNLLDPYWQAQTMTGPIRSNLSTASSLWCIDDVSGTTTEGTVIRLFGCNNAAAQNWSLYPDYTIRLAKTTTTTTPMCLSITGDGISNGDKTVLSACKAAGSNDNQLWHLDSNGQIWNPASGRCLDDPGGATTTYPQLEIWNCLLNNNQYWIDP